MHERLANELVFRLARRALAIVARCLREEERRDVFDYFQRAFREELYQYEVQRDRMHERLRGCHGRRKETAAERADEEAPDHG